MRGTPEEIANELRRIGSMYPEQTVRKTKAKMALIVNEFQNAVIEGTPKGVGGAAGLAGSVFGETRTVTNGIAGIVGSPLKYAETIEYGRKPGKMFPAEELVPWIEKKLGLPLPQAQRAAFPMMRKISLFGFATWPNGARMFEKGWDKIRDFAFDEIAKIPEEVLQEING